MVAFQRMTATWPNKALHRTAICAGRFALEFLVFIRQIVAVGELGRSAQDDENHCNNFVLDGGLGSWLF